MTLRLPAYVTLCLILLATALPAEEQWHSLFDGKTTKGWTPRAKVVSFDAIEGELQLLSKTNVWVTTEFEAGDFVLEGEVRIPDDAAAGFNSGIAFRCTGKTGKPKGYQIEIDGGKPGKTGGIYGIGLGGWLSPNKDNAGEVSKLIAEAKKTKDWNKLRVVCEGPRIRTYLNDTMISDIQHKGSLSGYFGIQHHGHGGIVRFRNLRVKKM